MTDAFDGMHRIHAAERLRKKAGAGIFPQLLGILLFLALLPRPAACLEIVPFYTCNQSPLIQIHGLPAIDNAALVPVGRLGALLSVDAANNFNIDSATGESLTLDGETYRFTLAARYGIAKGFEVGIDIPYVAHSGGFMDGFIEDFHHFFGFPNGGRESAPKDRLLYQYSSTYNDGINLSDSTSGIGDIRLTGAMQLYRQEGETPRAVSLRASLKLPTGNSHRLLGSGSTDFSLWFDASEDVKLPALGHLTGFAAIGGMVMSDGDVLKRQQRTAAGFASLGFGWSPIDCFALKVQANAHTPLYQDSNLREVNSSSVQLVSGGTFAFTKNTSLDLGISEDVIVDTSPDVVFTLTLRTMF